MPKLLVRHPERGEMAFTLRGECITVGRRRGNTIQIDHGTVSGHHAEIVALNGHYVIRDLGSTNHCFIDGEIVAEAELDRPCTVVLGSVECAFVPDSVDPVPGQLDTLRKSVGLLRRQNDELIAKVSEQQSQINILGHARLVSPGAGADLKGLRQQIKALTAERNRLADENRALRGEIGKLMGTPSGAGDDRSTYAPAHPLHDGRYAAIAALTAKFRILLQHLAREPADRNAAGEMLHLAGEMAGCSRDLEHRPVGRLCGSLYPLVHEIALRAAPLEAGFLRTITDSADFLAELLSRGTLSRFDDLPAPTIIAVEDDKDLLPAIVASLEFARLPTIGCTDAREALSTLQETRCDLILLDIGLPDLSGLDMCSCIRGLPKHGRTPIMFLTGQDTSENRSRGLLKGASDFIGKPFNVFELTLKAHTWALKHQFAAA